MQDLIRRSMRLWQRARRPGATDEEIARAVSAIPELCSALDGLARELEEARRAGAAAACRSERLGRYVCHEVRNRLNLVELSVELAATLSGVPGVRPALEPVRRAFQHLAAIADDLRAAAEPGGPERAPAPRRPLRAVVEDVLVASRALAEERDIALEVDGDLPEDEVDAARLELVLVNLLTNALRHADGGKREHWVRIQVRADRGEEGVLRIGVVDNGVGMAARRRATVFEDARGAPGTGTPASGMGLAIVRQAVERSGGRVWVESAEGVGTAVYFTLPLRERQRDAGDAPPASAAAGRV